MVGWVKRSYLIVDVLVREASEHHVRRGFLALRADSAEQNALPDREDVFVSDSLAELDIHRLARVDHHEFFRFGVKNLEEEVFGFVDEEVFVHAEVRVDFGLDVLVVGHVNELFRLRLNLEALLRCMDFALFGRADRLCENAQVEPRFVVFVLGHDRVAFGALVHHGVEEVHRVFHLLDEEVHEFLVLEVRLGQPRVPGSCRCSRSGCRGTGSP